MALHVDPNRWRGTVRGRLLVVALAFAGWIAAIQGRLVLLQVFQHEQYVERAKGQQTEEIELPAQRGEIVDRHGELLAYSVDADTIWAVPAKAPSAEVAVARLCGALGDCSAEETSRLVARFRQKRAYAVVRRFVSAAQASRVRELALPWVGFRKEPRRWYPNKELAAHLLGYVGLNDLDRMDRGLAGVERSYDKALRGRPGKQRVLKNEEGQAFLSSIGEAPVPGDTLELTIDKALQFVAERELHAAVAEHQAQGGCVVVMDPHSGEILALANAPGFNPNVYKEVPADQHRNRAVQDPYEPGSTFKVITAAAALDQKAARPDDIIDTGNGSTRLGNHTVSDTHAHGAITFREVITKSSNVGAIRISQRLGRDLLGRYVKAFGFGVRISGDFPGESPGTVWNPAGWSEVTTGNVSYGYGLSVTPLQLAAAFSAIANGGELVQPRVLRAVIRGNSRTVVPRRVIRRAIQPETAVQLTEIMEGVTEQGGTATVARIEGYTVAGKTGTAQKLVNGRYVPVYNGSFGGFLPSRDPVATIFVMLDSPRRGGYYGGVVAAPAFRRIGEAVLRRLAVPPPLNPVPPVLIDRGRPSHIVPVAGSAHPLTIVPAAPLREGELLLPELRGLGGRAALLVLLRLGLGARMTGDGVVTAQEPPAGTPMEPGSSCRLWLARTLPNPPPGSRP